MTNSKQGSDFLARAGAFWHGGQPLEAGRLIFEDLSPERRPAWACQIFLLVLAKSGLAYPMFDQLVQTASNQRMWGNGHRIFSMFRKVVLQLSSLSEVRPLTKEQKLLHGLLVLGELVAKVTYNGCDPPDSFDEDSGWWIAVCLRAFVDDIWIGDVEFADAAWSTLCFLGQ